MGAVLFSRQMVSDFLCERHFFQFYRRFLITIKVFFTVTLKKQKYMYICMYIPYEMYFVLTLVLTSSEERNFQEIFQVFFCSLLSFRLRLNPFQGYFSINETHEMRKRLQWKNSYIKPSKSPNSFNSKEIDKKSLIHPTVSVYVVLRRGV